MKPIKVFRDGVVEVNDVKYCFDSESEQRLEQYQDEYNKNISNQCSKYIDKLKDELGIADFNRYGVNQHEANYYRFDEMNRNWEYRLAIEQKWEKKKICLNITKCENISIYVGLLCVEYEDGYNDFVVLGRDCDSFRHYYDIEKAFPVKSRED